MSEYLLNSVFDKTEQIISLRTFHPHKSPNLRGFCACLLLVCYLRRTTDFNSNLLNPNRFIIDNVEQRKFIFFT